MAVTGMLIAESLGVNAVVDVPLTVQRLERITAHSVSDDQPALWTLIDFTCADEDADRLAGQLAAALAPGNWYADYATDTTRYVVFAGKIFAYPRGDQAGRAAAVAYARSVGVPPAQLDWPA